LIDIIVERKKRHELRKHIKMCISLYKQKKNI
jgi:hypothetical protein